MQISYRIKNYWNATHADGKISKDTWRCQNQWLSWLMFALTFILQETEGSFDWCGWAASSWPPLLFVDLQVPNSIASLTLWRIYLGFYVLKAVVVISVGKTSFTRLRTVSFALHKHRGESYKSRVFLVLVGVLLISFQFVTQGF